MALFKSTTLSGSTDNVTPANKAWHTALLADLADGYFSNVGHTNAVLMPDTTRQGWAFGPGGAVAPDTYFEREAAGVFAARNAADDAYSIIRGASPVGDNDLITKAFAAAAYVRADGTIPLTGDWNTGLTNGVQVPWLQLDTTYSDGSVEGRLQWNAIDGTAEVGMPGGNVTLQIGQEQLVYCKNTTAAGITNGLAVYISGAVGDRPEIALADASAEHPTDTPIGLATEDIAVNEWGYVTIGGLVRDVDTSAIAEGGIAYLSETSPGGYRATIPDAPNTIAVLGYCIKQNANSGIMLSHMSVQHKVTHMSDVNHVSPSADGQIIAWDQSGAERFELVDHGTPYGNNVKDLGASSMAWKTGYFGTSVIAPILALTDGVAEPDTVSGKAFLYVDTADGDLKVKFGDGTIKTLSTDT